MIRSVPGETFHISFQGYLIKQRVTNLPEKILNLQSALLGTSTVAGIGKFFAVSLHLRNQASSIEFCSATPACTLPPTIWPGQTVVDTRTRPVRRHDFVPRDGKGRSC